MTTSYTTSLDLTQVFDARHAERSLGAGQIDRHNGSRPRNCEAYMFLANPLKQVVAGVVVRIERDVQSLADVNQGATSLRREQDH
jgi:hypothetical protein